jgi:uncharacterized protein with beta-barrel porin domain
MRTLLNQQVQAGDSHALTGTGGVRLLGHLELANGRTIQLGTTLAIRQDLAGRVPSMTAAFEGAPGIPFAISGAPRDRTAVLTGADTLWNVTAYTTLKAAYEGEFASDRRRHALQGKIQFRF